MSYEPSLPTSSKSSTCSSPSCSSSPSCGGECLSAPTTETSALSSSPASESPTPKPSGNASLAGLSSPPEEKRGASGTLLAWVARPTLHPDLRGQVRETYRASWFPTVPRVRQLVQSDSGARVLRGMHLHKIQWDIWRFVRGRAWVRLYDTVTDDQAFINADDNIVIAIPPGISHGFFTQQGATLVYALTNEYDGTDEYSWRPFDGLSNVDPDWPGPSLYGGWPTSPYGVVMSERDLRSDRLKDFRP